jgi:hypothetical protein
MCKQVLGLVPLMFVVACGGSNGSNPGGPSNSIPNVAGNYSGSTSIVYTELGRSLTCPTSTSVTQSGNTVNIAPLVLSGSCGNLSIPVGQGTIDATGAIDSGSASGTQTDATCGTYNYTVSGGFFGRDMRLSATASFPSTSTCYSFSMTTNLSH